MGAEGSLGSGNTIRGGNASSLGQKALLGHGKQQETRRTSGTFTFPRRVQQHTVSATAVLDEPRSSLEKAGQQQRLINVADAFAVRAWCGWVGFTLAPFRECGTAGTGRGHAADHAARHPPCARDLAAPSCALRGSLHWGLASGGPVGTLCSTHLRRDGWVGVHRTVGRERQRVQHRRESWCPTYACGSVSAGCLCLGLHFGFTLNPAMIPRRTGGAPHPRISRHHAHQTRHWTVQIARNAGCWEKAGAAHRLPIT